MPEYIYDVVLKTQLGLKRGIMSLHIEQENINGYLDILQHSEPFNGEIDITGDCIYKVNLKHLYALSSTQQEDILTKVTSNLSYKVPESNL